MTKRISLAEIAHDNVREHLRVGDTAIDATVGNGHDTMFLAQCVGESGHVHGFDIQAQALQKTRQSLQAEGLQDRVSLHLASHAEMALRVSQACRGRIQAIMFNLGYLPGADKSLITQPDSTLPALQAACGLLAPQGIITVMAYPGHAGGDEETMLVEQWLGQLESERYQVGTIFSAHHQASAPRLFVIRKWD